MADTSNFRNGMVLDFKSGLWTIVDFQHVKPGKGPAFVRTRLKNVTTGKVVDETFRAGERIEEVRLERRDYQFLFKDGEFLTFMSLETYEQISLPADTMEDLTKYVKESETVSMLLREGTPLTVEPPASVELKVTQTDPGVRGDTAQGGTKPATMETGLVVLVPLFIEEGETLRVDTRTGKYMNRV